jgi:hypothetical protein
MSAKKLPAPKGSRAHLLLPALATFGRFLLLALDAGLLVAFAAARLGQNPVLLDLLAEALQARSKVSFSPTMTSANTTSSSQDAG